jgi:hypothetical protein
VDPLRVREVAPGVEGEGLLPELIDLAREDDHVRLQRGIDLGGHRQELVRCAPIPSLLESADRV